MQMTVKDGIGLAKKLADLSEDEQDTVLELAKAIRAAKNGDEPAPKPRRKRRTKAEMAAAEPKPTKRGRKPKAEAEEELEDDPLEP